MVARKYLEDERVIAAFLNNFRMVDVIKETGLSKNTCYKIRNDPEFQRTLRERKSAILKSTVNKMQGYLLRDAEILQQIIEDPETPKQVRVNAINTKWSHLKEWTTTTDLLERLDALQNPINDVFETV